MFVYVCVMRPGRGHSGWRPCAVGAPAAHGTDGTVPKGGHFARTYGMALHGTVYCPELALALPVRYSLAMHIGTNQALWDMGAAGTSPIPCPKGVPHWAIPYMLGVRPFKSCRRVPVVP